MFPTSGLPVPGILHEPFVRARFVEPSIIPVSTLIAGIMSVLGLVILCLVYIVKGSESV